MEIKTYTRKNLGEFIRSAEFEKLTSLPISSHRALSQINNPRAGDDDLLLAVQFIGGDMIGYLGVLPDYLYQGTERIKIGWLSCFWIDEAWRSQPVAAGLFLTVMEAWEHRILITNFVPSLESLYRKSGFFQPVVTYWGVRAYLRSNLAEVLPPKSQIFVRIQPILKLADSCINLAGDLRFLFFRKYDPADIQFSFVSAMDDDMAGFIDAHQQDNATKRGKTEFEWILSYPWIKEKPKPDSESKRYYFSSVSKRFRYEFVKATKANGSLVAVMLLCIRNNNLTVPYLFADAVVLDKIAGMLGNTMVKYRLSMLTVFNTPLAERIAQLKGTFLHTRRIRKPYLISRHITPVSHLNFQDGDGDCVFY